MDSKLVANYLTSLKEKSGLTFEVVAKKSERSVATVKNLSYGKSEDPRIDTVAPVIYAMGGSLDEMYTGKNKDEMKEVSINSIKEIYEQQLSEMNQTHEKHIDEIRAHYEQHRQDYKNSMEQRLAEKDKTIEQQDRHIVTLKREGLVKLFFGLISVSVLLTILILEVMNPNLGWIRF